MVLNGIVREVFLRLPLLSSITEILYGSIITRFSLRPNFLEMQPLKKNKRCYNGSFIERWLTCKHFHVSSNIRSQMLRFLSWPRHGLRHLHRENMSHSWTGWVKGFHGWHLIRLCLNMWFGAHHASWSLLRLCSPPSLDAANNCVATVCALIATLAN